MAKSSRRKVQDDKEKILRIMIKDAGLDLGELAKEAKFSRQKLWRILKSLEKEKAFWKKTILADPTFFGLKRYFIMMGLNTSLNGFRLNDRFVKEMEKQELMLENAHFINAPHVCDLVMTVWAKDLVHARKVCGVVDKLDDGAAVAEVMVCEEIFPFMINTVPNPDTETLKELS